jgi:hypothetical protein
MTGWEVLGDAVKIGLGAAIGLLGAKLAHAREWKKEKSNRRIATLEKITEDFEKAHQAIIDHSVEIKTQEIRGQPHLPESGEVGKLVRGQINSVDARLALLGLKTCSESVQRYYKQLRSTFDTIRVPGEERDNELRNLHQARNDFYALMQAEYERAQQQ